jgi:hypothetical protein
MHIDVAVERLKSTYGLRTVIIKKSDQRQL